MHNPTEDLIGVPKTSTPGDSTAKKEAIQTGDWVSIKDAEVAALYFEGIAKVAMLIPGLIDVKGKPVIIPEKRSSPREREFYAEQCKIGTRQELRAVLYGAKADGSGWLEYQKAIPTRDLEKTEKPTDEPTIKKPAAKKKKTKKQEGDENGNGNGNGNGNFAFPKIPETEKADDGIHPRRNRTYKRER